MHPPVVGGAVMSFTGGPVVFAIFGSIIIIKMHAGQLRYHVS